MRLSRRALLTVLPLSLASAGVGYSFTETFNLEVSRLRLGLGSKIAFMVDTHTHEFGVLEERVVDYLAGEQPDILIHGGDFVDRLTSSLKPLKEYLSLIEAGQRIAVLGNHDYWSGWAPELSRMLKDLGFIILRDKYVETGVGRVFGVDWRDDRRYGLRVGADLIVAHDPNAASVLERGFMLAGHTHGGVVLWGVTVLSNSRYTRGLYRLGDNRVLYVSRGLGQMLPLRPTSPPELLVIE